MKLNPNYITSTESLSIGLSNTSTKINLGDVFSQNMGSYLNEFTLFLAHFNAIPNYIQEVKIDCRRAGRWFGEFYKSEIKDVHFSKRYLKGSKKAEYDDLFYILYDDLLVYFDTSRCVVRFLFRKTDVLLVEMVAKQIRKFKNRKGSKNPQISLLVSNFTGMQTVPFNITSPKMNLADNYNDDFTDIHKTILKRLSKDNDKGLVLLHGKPGTGKTSYIRYLITKLKKEVIFLPPNMASAITNPDLISVLTEHPNSIFVIEDAENIVIDRDSEGNSPVSALLNISDGLLSDCLNIQIICSFNTPLSKVDNALLRRGRLIAKYEFNELQTEKAQALSDKLGYSTQFTEPMALTGIYNQEEKDFQPVKRKRQIGFVSVN